MRPEIALALLAGEHHKQADLGGTGGSKPLPASQPLGARPGLARPPGPKATPGAVPAGKPPAALLPAAPKPQPPAGLTPTPPPPPAAPGTPAPGAVPAAAPAAPAAPAPAPAGGGMLDGLLGSVRGMSPEHIGQLMGGMAPVTKAVAGVGGLPAVAGLTDLIRGGGNMQTLLRGPDPARPGG